MVASLLFRYSTSLDNAATYCTTAKHTMCMKPGTEPESAVQLAGQGLEGFDASGAEGDDEKRCPTFWRVMTTPQGTGAPMNLWPDTDTDPIGFLKDTLGARLMKGICADQHTRMSAPLE
jgi:hypothetical protein